MIGPRPACLLLAVFCGLGCGGKPADPPADLTPVVHPALGSIEAVARGQLEKQRQALDAALAKGAERRTLAGAFGDMGELYHAYELTEPAAVCYSNAETLDPESFLWPFYLGALQQAAGDLEAAAASLERALELRDDDLPARRRLGEVRLALGDGPGARAHFEFLLDAEAYAAAAHFGLGRIAATTGDARGAVAHFERVLQLQPAAGSVHHSRGLALRDLGRFDEAREQLGKKAAGEVHSPDRLMERLASLAIGPGAHLKRGNRALMAGRLDEAEAELRSAVAADPRAVGARRNLALVLARRGDADGAIEELKAAAEIDPEDVWIQVDLGNAYMSQGLAESAARAFERAVELDPAQVQARFNLANAHIGLERWNDARPHLETVLRLDPGHRRARYQLAMTRHHSGDSSAAIRDLRGLLKEQPAFTAARRGLATVLTSTRRGREAIAVYRQGLDLDLPAAERIELLSALAQLAWRESQRQAAIDYWRRITDLEPGSSKAWTDLANALQLAGKRREARGDFARAVELDPSNATAWLSEARLWILAGEFQTALERLEAALVQVPDDAGLNDTLARLLATCPSAEIRDGQRAMALSRKAYALDNSIEHAATFGMAVAEAGRFEEAIRWQRSLINEAARTGNQKALPQLIANLRRYENRLPVRMSVKP